MAQDNFDDLFDPSTGGANAIDPVGDHAPVSKTNPPQSPQPETGRKLTNEPGSDSRSAADSSETDLVAGLSVPGQSTTETQQPDRLEGADPFEVNPDAPLKVDGIGDLYSHADVYGVKCNICDTRIHVRPEQAGTHVKCPECYSEVYVPKPEPTDKPTQRWVKEGRGRDTKTDSGDELKLSDPIERPKIDYNVDESYGLEAPAEDLLAPKPKHDGSDIPELEILDDSAETTVGHGTDKSAKPAPSKARSKSNLSRRELYEEAQRKQQAAESGTVYRANATDDDESSGGKDYPNFDVVSLLMSSVEMLRSPGVMLRATVAIALMSFGTIVMQWFIPTSAPPAGGDGDASLAQRLFNWAQWGVLGLLPYTVGVLMLWFTSAYIFRDAALGKRYVESWKNVGTSEVIATFLIFAFGFFIGGLPAAFLTLMTLPLRVLFGPLLLLGAWYNRDPFAIVSVDAYKNFSDEVSQWTSFYTFMAGLAFFSFVAGLIFWMRAVIPGSLFVLSMFVSVVGVVLVVAVTLIFAAVCGWHCGRVTDKLEI